jgi:hypothetical protein
VNLTCPHSQTTAADGSGRAVCVRCGCVVRVGGLRYDDLHLAFDRILYGVSYEDAWGNRIDPKDVHAGIPEKHPAFHPPLDLDLDDEPPPPRP